MAKDTKNEQPVEAAPLTVRGVIRQYSNRPTIHPGRHVHRKPDEDGSTVRMTFVLIAVGDGNGLTLVNGCSWPGASRTARPAVPPAVSRLQAYSPRRARPARLRMPVRSRG